MKHLLPVSLHLEVTQLKTGGILLRQNRTPTSAMYFVVQGQILLTEERALSTAHHKVIEHSPTPAAVPAAVQGRGLGDEAGNPGTGPGTEPGLDDYDESTAVRIRKVGRGCIINATEFHLASKRTVPHTATAVTDSKCGVWASSEWRGEVVGATLSSLAFYAPPLSFSV